jgi:hypothetical protein
MTETLKFPSVLCSDVLTEVLRAGAQRPLALGLQIEIQECVDTHTAKRGHKAPTTG